MVKIIEEKKTRAEADARTVKTIRDSYVEQIAGALPLRESKLFHYIENRANVYQIQEGLLEEQHYYEELTDKAYTAYEKSKEDFSKANERFISAKALNERLLLLEQAKLKHQQALSEKPLYEQKRLQVEAAQRATMLFYLDEQCKAMSEDLKQKQFNLQQLEQQMQQVEQQFSLAKSTVAAEKENEAVRQTAENELLQLQALKPIYEQIDEFYQVLQQAIALRSKLQAGYEQKEKSITSQKEKLQYIQKEIMVLEDNVKNIPTILQQVHEHQKIVELFTKWSEVSGQVANLNEQYLNAIVAYEEAKESYGLEEKKWLSNQAQILASTLVPGSACPVCGSTEHQVIHFDEANSADDKKMQQLKAAVATAEQTRNVREVQYNVVKMKVEELVENLRLLNVSLEERDVYVSQLQKLLAEEKRLKQENEKLAIQKAEQASLSEHLQQMEQSLKELNEQLKLAEQSYFEKQSKYDQQKQALNEAIQDLPTLELRIRQQEIKVQELKRAWEQAQQQFQQAQIALEKHKQSVQFTTSQIEELTSKLEQSRQQFIDKMREAKFESYAAYQEAKLSEQQIAHLREEYMQFINDLHALEVKIQEEGAALQHAVMQDVTALETQVASLKTIEEQSFEAYKLAQKHEALCKDFYSKLETVAAEIFRLEEETNQLIDLHNLLKGQNAKKISFERYVQIGYLEQITEAANVRLRNLSNGQYSLICSDRQESHGRQSGLSLDVYDSYTGQTRDVKTLSGGEKFNASLSLALGMADVIQSFQGNVRIDTMFIDEGFGSLDEESLMRAIDTLFELQNTGRMIGVISHVSELKDAFPAILQVEKQKEGYSKTKFVLK
jgi:DNA repair protein SbcC/Rad50